MARRLIKSFSKNKSLEFYEDDSGALDGREVAAWLINYVVTDQTETIGDETVIVSSSKEYKRVGKIMGIEQSLSQPIGMLNSDGYREHAKKTFTVRNTYKELHVGDRMQIRDKWFSIFSHDRFSRENFTVYYLEEISRNEAERPA